MGESNVHWKKYSETKYEYRLEGILSDSERSNNNVNNFISDSMKLSVI